MVHQDWSSWYPEQATPQHGDRYTCDYRIWYSPQQHKTYYIYWYYSDNARRVWYYYWDPQGGNWWYRCRNWMHPNHNQGGNWSKWEGNDFGAPGDPPVLDQNTGEEAMMAPDPPVGGVGTSFASTNLSFPTSDPVA